VQESAGARAVHTTSTASALTRHRVRTDEIGREDAAKRSAGRGERRDVAAPPARVRDRRRRPGGGPALGGCTCRYPTNQLGWWAPWVGVLLVGIGNYLYFSAPGGSLGWLLVVLYAAWIGQYLGDQAVGGYLSGFVGAIVMTPVTYIVERRPSGPPALVSFLPAFWQAPPRKERS
jgi:hypothetical protein